MAPMLRKASHGSIRSPHVKRDIQSQVVIEGWLFKLERGALKQWKQRWCVLADFCLFFYKDQNEEKVTSSILLPSYKINPCCTDDKISRKFAFKAEHHNMKTYYFAAEDKESMKKWMNAMSLASIVQKFVKSKNNDATFSSSNDDEDNGFLSYHSRQYANHRLNSAPDTRVNHELHRQRSNSYGERVGEMYLSSDDKYPNTQFQSNHSLHSHRRQEWQPLYANAPPKPRRSDPYAIAPGDCYGSSPPQFQVPSYPHYYRDGYMYPVPPHETRESYPNNYFAEGGENASDPYKNQPQRPHSADFLEHEAECYPPNPNTVQHCEKPQPQRPKSSLEYYNRCFDSEECSFDDYREAVRMQADHLYSNRNLLGRKAHASESENLRRSDQRLNIHYVRDPAENQCNMYGPQPHHQKNLDNRAQARQKTHEESLRRLMEWKQRMLQSPLTKRNPQSNSSSDTGSPMMSKEHQWKVTKELESHEAQLQKHGTQKQMYVPEKQVNTGYNYRPSETRNLNMPPEEPSRKENLNQNNIMYCVDSENNEILFSYEDNPIIDYNATDSVRTPSGPPQMHSFSTMPNVNDIGSDRHISSAPGKYGKKAGKSKHSTYNAECDNDSDIPSGQRVTTYSSDDEASADSDSGQRFTRDNIKYSVNMSRNVSDSEIHIREPSHLKKLVQQSEGLMCKGKRLSVSAGDLLGKTHEELVLLLIQLRRNQSKILRAKEKCEMQLENEQKLLQLSGSSHEPQSPSSRELQRQIKQLEGQYELTQPLVTLVDNMVKLGSLYGSTNRRSSSFPHLDIHTSDYENVDLQTSVVKEPSIVNKLYAEDHNLQRHISEMYTLDKGLRFETNSISSLQQDKEILESTLYGMKSKILDHQDRPVELQKLRKQQRMIEKELARVKRLLSTSAKKIEDAASKNDQLEQEILLLRQKLQQALKTGSSEMKASQQTRADLEAELTRVQNVLEELANHRHEINNTVEKLKSEARSKSSKGSEVRASPTGVAGSAPLPLRKKQHSMYLETDLDTMVTRDLAVAAQEKDFDDIPIYENAEDINNATEDSPPKETTTSSEHVKPPNSLPLNTEESTQWSLQDINDADDRMKRFYGIIPKEKPCEIKTVRIVKRQSERRNRERDKKRVTYDDQSSVWVVEEPDISSDDHLEIDEGNVKVYPSASSQLASNPVLVPSSNNPPRGQSARERLFGTSSSVCKPPVANPERISPTKRSKRRHYTVSGYHYALDPQFAEYFKDRPRSRDDVDMERCLRTANTPDIVRSTIKKNEVYDDKIIERELGLPQKINIPERYIEVEPEHLSASEKLRRTRKAENICKMLSETTTSTYGDVTEERSKSPEALHKKLSEEKRKRAQLLSLNRALAREVVERSKAVAVFATLENLVRKPLTPVEEDLSPMTPLPITQQRYNFLT